MKAFCLYCLITEHNQLPSHQPHVSAVTGDKRWEKRFAKPPLDSVPASGLEHIESFNFRLHKTRGLRLKCSTSLKFTFQTLKKSFVPIKWGEVTLVYPDNILQPPPNELYTKRKMKAAFAHLISHSSDSSRLALRCPMAFDLYPSDENVFCPPH